MEYRWDRQTQVGQTDRQTYRQTDIFFIVVLGLWEANKTTKKILARSEKKTFGSRYGIIWTEFFGHIKLIKIAPWRTPLNRWTQRRRQIRPRGRIGWREGRVHPFGGRGWRGTRPAGGGNASQYGGRGGNAINMWSLNRVSTTFAKSISRTFPGLGKNIQD